MQKVYRFDEDCEDKQVLGNKGANLVTMTRLGLPVPPGFTLSLEAFKDFQGDGTLPVKEIDKALAWLEKSSGKALGEGLMVSVRSSAAVSMPGMMDTVLNVSDRDQMTSCIAKVFASWDAPRAVEYRRLSDISRDIGMSLVVQAMVMGDVDNQSGTGVVFSRNPSTGAKGIFGEYLTRAQGEELVSGESTPRTLRSLKRHMPEAYAELEALTRILESHFQDMQDIEFTIESGKLYILQTRNGKRSGQAAVKIAVDMVDEGLISRNEALLRITPADLRALLHNRIQFPERYQPIARGLNAAPGSTFGTVVFEPADVVAAAKANEKIILVRPETSPDDIRGIAASTGVLTSRGGLTSHAAIVTRAMGKPCVCGAEQITVDLKKEQFKVGDTVVNRGDIITIDGNSGNVYLGALPMLEAEATPELSRLLDWADEAKQIGVWGNADTAEMAALAKKHGAEGIGLCRTERQFNGAERLAAIREFIMGETGEEQEVALAKLRDLQREDFIALFQELQGMPVIVRLLDLPLHEFLPMEEQTRDPRLKRRLEELREVNPMLGHRGVRLAVTSPEVYQMQVEAIAEAKAVVDADVSIMVPQVITLQELLWVKTHMEGWGFRVGIMMETVRACMRAGKLAAEADFFSFGTNDLTQAVYSFSREDAEKKFLTTYLDHHLLDDNPFEVVDVKGVGRLMETAIYWAREEKADLDIGVCGEQAGEPRSVGFFHDIGISYVSCSPYRIPVAKLAAAQAAINNPRKAPQNGPAARS